MKPRLLILPLLLATLALSSGCIRLGPDFAPPGSPAKPPAQFQHGGQGPGAYQSQDRWWHCFGDPVLNKYVEMALARNWDIKAAAARVLEVRAQFRQARAQRYPSLDLNASAAKTQYPSGTTTKRRIEDYDLNLAASFELDLWGRLARTEEAARADLLTSQENQRTVIQGVIAQVVSAYLTMESLERRLAVNHSSQKAYETSLSVVNSRYLRGLTTVLALRQARRALARERAAKPQIRQDLGKQQQILAILCGSYPKTRTARSQPEDYFPNLQPVPAGLPSQILLRRPDLLAAQANLNALTARVGAAKAARFPTLRLTATYGYSSSSLGNLVRPGSELWNLAAGLVQPLFDAGKLEAGQRAAEARLQQAQANYAGAVLTAFQEVEGALLTRKEQLERRKLLKVTLKEAIATEQAAKQRYLRGLIDYLQVLEAQFTRYTIEDSLVLAELALLTNRVALHRALGGGWDHLKPLAKGKEAPK